MNEGDAIVSASSHDVIVYFGNSLHELIHNQTIKSLASINVMQPSVCVLDHILMSIALSIRACSLYTKLRTHNSLSEGLQNSKKTNLLCLLLFRA